MKKYKKMGHTDFTIQPEHFTGLLPITQANEIADLFNQGKSVKEVQGTIRVNGSKVSIGVIKTVFGHIKQIEVMTVNILNGTSIIYNPPISYEEYDEEGNGIGEGVPAWEIPALPTTKEELIVLMMQVVAIDWDKYTNVYDAVPEDVVGQVSHVLDNIITSQNNGTGTWEDLYNALKPE